jgi:hypothetical protein
MSLPAVTYITPPITSGVTWMPLAPVSKVQAGWSVATFCGVIRVSGENAARRRRGVTASR